MHKIFRKRTKEDIKMKIKEWFKKHDTFCAVMCIIIPSVIVGLFFLEEFTAQSMLFKWAQELISKWL